MARRSGFSLIEAAIVLGIIGLVIGGIWAAAAAVQEKNRIATLAGQLVQVRANMCKLFKGHAPAQMINSQIISAGVIPQGMLTQGLFKNSNVYFYDPLYLGHILSFGISSSVSVKECMAIHQAFQAAGIRTGIKTGTWSDGTTGAVGQGVDLSTALDSCQNVYTDGGLQEIYFPVLSDC